MNEILESTIIRTIQNDITERTNNLKKDINKFLLLSGLVTASIHCINRLFSSMGTSKNILETKIDKTYEWRFGKIRYTKEGTGTPILLIHNETPGSSLYEFHKISHLLANDHEVYAIDLLGYGLSEKTDITYTNFLYVELINDFIQTVIGRKTDIITSGHSAMIAIEAAMQNEKNIRKIMMINPPDLYQMNAIPSNQTKLMKWLIGCPILGTFIYHICVSETQIQNQFINDYFYDKKKIKENDILSYVEACNKGDSNAKYTLTSFYAKYMNTNIINSLKTINHSMMIIGTPECKEQKTIIDNYRYYNASIEYEEIPKTKTLAHLEAPHAVFHLAKIFIH